MLATKKKAPPKIPARWRKLLLLLPGYDCIATASQCWFDVTAADAAIDFIENCLTHFRGELGGKPLLLEPWQKAFVGAIFGWKRPDGMRRYREVLLYVPRKNGKSCLCAAIILTIAFLDKEPGAELYSAASNAAQALMVYDQARAMVEQEPDLADECEIHKAVKTIFKDGVWHYRAISADAGKNHGKNVHAAIIDELHEQPNRDLVDAFQTSTGARRQPLIIYATTADYDRESICNEKRDYAIKVRDGILKDEKFLPVIYEASEQPYNESVSGPAAISELERQCTCGCVSNTLIVQLWQKVCAKHAAIGNTNSIRNTTARDAVTIPSDPCGQVGYAPHVTSSHCSTGTPSTNNARFANGLAGPPPTLKGSSEPATTGERNRKTSERCPSEDDSSFMELRRKNTTSGSSSLAECVRSAKKNENISAWITATSLEIFGDYSAGNATRDLAFSEMLSQLYCAHSDTCAVRKSTLGKSGTLIVQRPGDDWTDPKVWAKCNPNLGVSKSLEYMRDECRKAQEIPSYENTFKRLELDIKTTSNVVWLPMVAWDGCGKHGPFIANDTEGGRHDCYVGLDLATTTDVAAAAFLFPPTATHPWRVLMRFWIPADNARQRERRDRVPYETWARQGLITMTDGNVIDYDVIRRDINQMGTQYNIKKLAIDRWNASQITSQLMGDGFDVVQFGQGYASMNAPSVLLEKLVLGGQLAHGSNPVLRWMASNCMVETDAAGNKKPSKSKSIEKIDGIVALIMALGIAGQPGAPAGRYYETHEVEFV